jgi:3-polyprenyl-4-hydroxybenzoate decarboxylase
MDQGKLALAAALNSHPSIKHAFLVDEDVDIFDEKEVLMALANRFLGDKDLLVLEDRPTDTLDPIITGTTAAKVGFDCTKPVGRPFPKQLGIPEEVRQRVRPEEFLDLAKLARTSTEPYG